MSTVDSLYRFDFEKPIAEIARRMQETRKGAETKDESPAARAMSAQMEQLKRKIYGNLTPWQRIQIARHPLRPYTLDYIHLIMSDFMELHGDRLFGDDKALIGGIAKFEGKSVMVMGHQKGRDTKENLMRNFGSAHPEGYRKALRLMQMAEKYHMPLIIFVDTPGAYPGAGAEERGQASSIAVNIREMARIKTSIYLCVIGEGGSGGALGIGVSDWTAMLENAYYSVISPEGCAAILWRDRAKAPEAAAALKLTGKDLSSFGLVDEVIDEPQGGAHHDPAMVAERIKQSILRFWKSIDTLSIDELLRLRYDRFRRIGVYNSASTAQPEAIPSVNN
jgi:acetyl-CoA carboxylase carboxyl transferase subunit alpha